jgi:UDP-2-acetamido-3-amino-2,3-dideoxy-glucuronate N-acetyltransferase
MSYFVHETAVVDEGCQIGTDTKIWRFSPIMPNCVIGEKCNIGQNVVISPKAVLGRNVKI